MRQKIIDHNDFSTETGYLKPGEFDFRSEICLNGKWDFQPVALPNGFTPGESTPELPLPDPQRWETVKLKVPSPWNINGLVDGDGIPGGDFVCYPSYPKSWNLVKMGWMRRTLHVPEGWRGKKFLLHFEAVCGHCQVFIDGKKVGEHFDNSLPHSYPVDDFVTPGKDHELWVGVRAPELFNVNKGSTQFTYPTGSFFNLHATGIWQDVFLLALPNVHIKDVFVQPDLSADQLSVRVTVENWSEQPVRLTINGIVKALKSFSFPEDGVQVLPHYELEDHPSIDFPGEPLTVPPNAEAAPTLTAAISGKLQQWDMETPNLYAVLVALEQDGQIIDRKYTRFGWREFKIIHGDFYLNQRKIQIKGDSWHFMGIPQITRRYAYAWYRSLRDAGGNGVRLHAMPYPTFYLEVADEMGICVLDESAIWASHCQNNYDEQVTWERFYEHVSRLVKRDRNYPSVMGWSVENEVRMALDAHFPSEETIAGIQGKICRLLDIVRELDPTRDWVSADGSRDWYGKFPTSILHYENKESYPDIKKEASKPVGVGECTIAYYGTPKHAEAFIGDLAYQGMDDRMKGVAIETYGQLKAQLSADFSYTSVFNLVWYGLKPLPLGHAYQENAPTIENGITFGEYREGKPGVQPERLGPYCTTLNPGYDPSLPLYAPNPMYDAIRAAFSLEGSFTAPYATIQTSPPRKPLPLIEQPMPVVFFGKIDGVHDQGLKAAGIQFSKDPMGNFIYADLASISPEQEKKLKTRVETLRSVGGTVFLSGLTPASARMLENLMGEKIEIFEREASSLVFGDKYANTDPLVDHFRLNDLYFSEDDDHVIQRYGIRCQNLEITKVLLKACSCDWRMWNQRSETSKTAALYRSEKESPEANALLKFNLGEARILLTTIEMREHRSVSEQKRKAFWSKLMQAAGAQIADDSGKEERFSTHTPAGLILKNPQAKAVVRQFIPMVAMLTEDMIAEISAFSIRELARMHAILLRLGSSKLDQIDQALGKIPMESKNSTSMDRDSLKKTAPILKGDQIVQVLAAGFFAGSDCASMLDEDFLGGENNADPVPGDEIVRGSFSTAWQVQNAGHDGFHAKENSTCYLSFYLNSPRQLDNLLIEPNVPKLYLNVETGCCIRVWLNGKGIFTQEGNSARRVNSQIPLLLRKGNNHILMKVVNTDTDCAVKASLSSSHVDFVEKLTGAVAQ